MEAVYASYSGLAAEMDAENGLGGKLLYAGEPDEEGCRLLRAANIAGAASLAASADAPSLRRAMREGAIDYVVTSLDEALRILKNEIRKKQAVAVGVSILAENAASEMLERGVQPDLLAAGLAAIAETEVFRREGARMVKAQAPPGGSFRILPVPPDWKQPAAAYDALLLECVPAHDHVNRRWVRLAPRYLGAETRRLRSLVCDADAVGELSARVDEARSDRRL